MAQQPIHESQIGDIPASKITGTINAGSVVNGTSSVNIPAPNGTTVFTNNGVVTLEIDSSVWALSTRDNGVASDAAAGSMTINGLVNTLFGRSANLTHTFSAVTDTSNYLKVAPISSVQGGVTFSGFSTSTTYTAIELVGSVPDGLTSFTAKGPINFKGVKSNGGSGIAQLDSDEIVVSYSNNNTVVASIRADGTIHAGGTGFHTDVGMTTALDGGLTVFTATQSRWVTRNTNTISTYTVRFPNTSLVDGRIIHMTFSGSVTTLTIDGNGATVINPVTTIPAGGYTLSYVYDADLNEWYKI